MSRAHVDDTPPVNLNVDNGAAITTAVSLVVASNRTLYAWWFWVPTTNTGTYTLEIWDVTGDDDPGPASGDLLASKAVASGDVIAGQYNRIELDTPLAVVTTKVYRAARHATSGRYVSTSLAFNGASISNAGITLIESGTNPGALFPGVLRNGTFREGTAGNYPASSFNASDYGIDVDDEPLAGDTVEVAGVRSTTATIVGTVAVDRNASGTRAIAFTGSGTLGAVARAQGNRTLGFAATGEISIRSSQPAEPTTNSGGWYSYLNILHNMAEEVRNEAIEPPEACPDCGEPVRSGPNGELFCTFDGWQWNGAVAF